jgi:hypothetical protein
VTRDRELSYQFIIIFLWVLLVVACTTVRPNPNAPPEVWKHDGEAPPGVEHVLDVIRASSPCPIAPGTWRGHIWWVPAPFMCGKDLAGGCWTGAVANSAAFEIVGPPTITDVKATALVHEVGHYVWTVCRRANADHNPEFMAWVEATRAKL